MNTFVKRLTLCPRMRLLTPNVISREGLLYEIIVSEEGFGVSSEVFVPGGGGNY